MNIEEFTVCRDGVAISVSGGQWALGHKVFLDFETIGEWGFNCARCPMDKVITVVLFNLTITYYGRQFFKQTQAEEEEYHLSASFSG